MKAKRVQKADKKHCRKRAGNRRRKKNLHSLHNLGKVMFVFILHGCQTECCCSSVVHNLHQWKNSPRSKTT
jgi:hypothetical protein